MTTCSAGSFDRRCSVQSRFISGRSRGERAYRKNKSFVPGRRPIRTLFRVARTAGNVFPSESGEDTRARKNEAGQKEKRRLRVCPVYAQKNIKGSREACLNLNLDHRLHVTGTVSRQPDQPRLHVRAFRYSVRGKRGFNVFFNFRLHDTRHTRNRVRSSRFSVASRNRRSHRFP